MSKKTRVLIGLFTMLVIGGGSFYILKPSKTNKNLVEKEISIKQAEVAKLETKEYEDYAGFKFSYPGDLKVFEVEIDNNSVYSSLEIRSSKGGKVLLRVADTSFKTLKDWQKDFRR